MSTQQATAVPAAPDIAQEPVAESGSDGLAVVRAAYEAFGRGDIPGFLDMLAADVTWDADWADNFGQRTHIEHFTPRRSRKEVADLFETYATSYTMHDFQVLDLMSSRDHVVAQVVIELSTPAGGRLRDEELHLWTVGPDGLVTNLRHYIDTAKHIAAFSGADTTSR